MTYKGIGEYRAITLTNAVGENVVGTTGNDTFKAVLDTGATTDSTLNIADSIDGLGGTDTLNLILVSANKTLLGGNSVDNVEVVKVDTSAGAFAVAATAAGDILHSSTYTGINELWQVDKVASNFVATFVGASVTAGFESTGVAASASDVGATGAGIVVNALNATQTTLNVALNGTADTYLDFAGAGVKTLNISGKIVDNAAPATLELDDGSGAINVQTLNLSLTGATTVDLTTAGGGWADLKTVDASKSTGAITGQFDVDTFGASAGGTATAFAVKGGSGADNLTVQIDDGGTAQVFTITLGAGADVITFETGAKGNLVAADTEQDLEDSMVVVTDFSKADDTLNLQDFNGGTQTAQNIVDAAIAGKTTLFDAATAAANVTAVGDISLFDFDGAMYVFYNDADVAGSRLDAGDGLIKLAGVSVADLDGTNYAFL